MSKSKVLLKSDLAWIALSIALTFIISFIWWGMEVFTGFIDIHVHDTYYVIPTHYAFLTLIFLTTFILFFVKSTSKRCRTSLSFGVVCITGAITVLGLAFSAFPISFALGMGGVTLYPPLSALGADQVSELNYGLPFMLIFSFLTLCAITVLVLTILKAYRWGQYRRNG